MKQEIKTKTKSSPPYEGGVAAASADGVVLSSIASRELKYIRLPSDINNLPELRTFRTELRKHLTPAEASFWKLVKNSQLEGRKFRRQHSVGKYILDFYCPCEKLGIELDGEVHFNDSATEYDYERKLFLGYFGIKVIRFENKLVFDEREWVVDRIVSFFGWHERTTPSAEAAATPPL